MLLYYGFILQDGTELKMDSECRLHEELALKYIKEERLSSSFRKSPYSDPVDFMVLELGAIKVGNMAKSTTITVSRSWLTDRILSIIKKYKDQGYRVDYIR